MGFLKNYRNFSLWNSLLFWNKNSSLALSSARSKQNEIKQTTKWNLWMMQSACVWSFLIVTQKWITRQQSNIDANMDRLHHIPSSSKIGNYSMQSRVKCHLNVKLNTGLLAVRVNGVCVNIINLKWTVFPFSLCCVNHFAYCWTYAGHGNINVFKCLNLRTFWLLFSDKKQWLGLFCKIYTLQFKSVGLEKCMYQVSSAHQGYKIQ